MNRFLKFVHKEFLHILRDKVTMLILFAMPIVMTVLFSYAVSSEVRNINTAVYAPGRDYLSSQIIEEFCAHKYFSVKRVVDSPSELKTVFDDGEISLVLVFDNNFAENAARSKAQIQILTDGTEANSAAMYANYAQGVINGFISRYNHLDESAPVVSVSVRMLYNPSGKSEYNFVPGVIGLMLLLINAMMSSVAIVREKERGTMEMLLASPLPPLQIILAKTVPYFSISSVITVMILLFARFVLGVPVAGSIMLLVSLCLIYVFLALSLGILISTLVKSQLAAMLISGMMLMIPTMLLSGMMFPIESMPAILQWISSVVPARWFIAALRKVMIQGADITLIAKELSVLVGMTAFILAAAVKKFNVRIDI